MQRSNKAVLWDVLAPVVRWPLRSRTRAALVAVAVVAVVVMGTRLSATGSTDGSEAAATPSQTSSESSAAESSATPPETDSSSTSDEAEEEDGATPTTAPRKALDLGRMFGEAWGNTKGVTADQWRSRLIPLADPYLAQNLAAMYPGSPSTVKSVKSTTWDETGGVVTVETSSGSLDLELVTDHEGYLVSIITPGPAKKPTATAKASSSSSSAAKAKPTAKANSSSKSAKK